MHPRMFKTTIELLDEYLRPLNAVPPAGFDPDLGCEARERLEQLDYLVSKIRDLVAAKMVPDVERRANLEAFAEYVRKARESNSTVQDGSSPPWPGAFNALGEILELQLFTECFYYVAFRLRTIIRNRKSPFSGLSNFECQSVRDIRVKLLEHSHEYGLTARSFGLSSISGPIIKPAYQHKASRQIEDRGLYPNAEEFKTNLEILLRRAVAGR